MKNVLGKPVSWSLKNSEGKDVKSSVSSSAIATIEKDANDIQRRMKELIENAKANAEANSSGGSFMDKVKENKQVVKVIISDVGFLCIAVVDDGVSKNAMATYYCRLAQQEGETKIKAVKI